MTRREALINKRSRGRVKLRIIEGVPYFEDFSQEARQDVIKFLDRLAQRARTDRMVSFLAVAKDRHKCEFAITVSFRRPSLRRVKR